MASRTDIRRRWVVDRQQLLILVVAAVMVGSFLLLVLWPKRRELSALGDAVELERGVVGQKLLASQKGVYVSARIPSLRKAQTLVNRRLPLDPDTAGFLQKVAECVAKEPLVTHEVKRTSGTPTASAPAVPVCLRLTGPFDAVHRCVADIEALERLNRVRRVSFLKAGDGGCVVAEAEILVYYLPAPEPKAVPAAPAGGGREDVEAANG
ncbi:MAG: hypothetical protein IMZ65_00720 [Planctomycetes bacterium]|nr:hypothetical protein [Planctomycetota bacterium]